MASRYAVGVDFGTESGRAVLVDVRSGKEIATAVHRYANGVIVDHLPEPNVDVRLGPDWALQDPDDYIATLERTIPRLLANTGIDPAEVIGLGVDFTSCTMLPATADGAGLTELGRDHPVLQGHSQHLATAVRSLPFPSRAGAQRRDGVAV